MMLKKILKKILSSLKPKNDVYFIIVLLILTLILFFIPTGFERPEKNVERIKASVLEADNSDIKQIQIIKIGYQNLKLLILDGHFKGQEIEANNQLIGKMEFDKMFKVGDIALVVLRYKSDKITSANVSDHYRLNIELFLFIIFILILIIFSGWTGIKAVLSFIFTSLFIWKVLLPAFLRGWNPIYISLIVVMILTAVILFSIGGLSKKSLVAFLGAFSGVLLTCFLSIVFGTAFKIHGAVKPFSEALLYTGYGHIDLGGIFLSGIFIASSGAVMDIAMDISASMNEIITKNPQISIKEAIFSGFEVGKAVIGTMTTTLLLAYSGGYTAMFMLFIAQGTPIVNILNLNYVSAEILHILVGSFGLITVAPFTAILGGFIYLSKKTNKKTI